jgi:hypothetical protein
MKKFLCLTVAALGSAVFGQPMGGPPAPPPPPLPTVTVSWMEGGRAELSSLGRVDQWINLLYGVSGLDVNATYWVVMYVQPDSTLATTYLTYQMMVVPGPGGAKTNQPMSVWSNHLPSTSGGQTYPQFPIAVDGYYVKVQVYEWRAGGVLGPLVCTTESLWVWTDESSNPWWPE